MDAPAHVGCLIEIRMLGVIEAEQTEEGKAERNDRLVGAAVHSYDHQDLGSIDDVAKVSSTRSKRFSSHTTSSVGRNSRSSASASKSEWIEFLNYAGTLPPNTKCARLRDLRTRIALADRGDTVPACRVCELGHVSFFSLRLRYSN